MIKLGWRTGRDGADRLGVRVRVRVHLVLVRVRVLSGGLRHAGQQRAVHRDVGAHRIHAVHRARPHSTHRRHCIVVDNQHTHRSETLVTNDPIRHTGR